MLIIVVLITVFALRGGAGGAGGGAGQGTPDSSERPEQEHGALGSASDDGEPTRGGDPERQLGTTTETADNDVARAGSRTDLEAVTGGGVTPPTGAASAGDAPGRVERYLEWCVLASEWYEPFRSELRESNETLGPHLGGVVRDAFRAVRAGDVEVDPLVATPGRVASIDRLLESPPALVRRGEMDALTEAAMGAIEGLRGLLRADAWPERASLDEVVASLAGEVPVDVASIGGALDGADGAAAFEAAQRLGSLGAGLGKIAEGLGRLDERVAGLHASGATDQADCLNGLPRSGQGRSEAWVASTVERVEGLITLGDELLGATDGIGRIDPALRDGALASAGGDRCEGAGSLRAWAGVMLDRSLYLLDPSQDPRRGLPDDEAVADLGRRIERLGDDGVAAATALAPERDAVIGLLDGVRELGWNEGSKEEIERRTGTVLARFGALAQAVDATEREQAFEADSFLAMVGARDSVSVTASGAIDEMWREARDGAVAAFGAGGSLVELTRQIERAEERAVALERAIPVPEIDLGVFGGAADRVAVMLGGAREDLIRSVGLDGSVEDAQEASLAWASRVSDSARSASELRSALDSWVPMDEIDYASMLDAWRGSWAGESIRAHEIDERLGLLERTVLEGDREGLVSVLRDADASAAVRYLAWRRLGVDDGWPTDAAAFRIDAGAVSALRVRAEELPGARHREVGSEFDSELTERWHRIAARSDRWVSFSDALRAASDFGVEPQGRTPELVYHLTLAGWKREGNGGHVPEAGEVLAFLQGVLQSGDGLDDAGLTWAQELSEQLEGRGEERVDFASIGPARAGWEVSAMQNGRFVEYWTPRPGKGPLSIGFTLVEGVNGGAVYLADVETPMAVLLEVMESEHAPHVSALLEADWRGYGDPRVGASVWAWGLGRGGKRGIQLNAEWLSRSRLSDGRSVYAPGLGGIPDPPAEEHPIQRVTAHAAAAIAAVVGCRLPTADEWMAAHAESGRPSASADWNLRDGAFETQRLYAESLGDVRSPPWPDLGVFAAPGETESTARSAVSHPWSDGFLWFQPVREGPERTFRHLIGNVAEFVLVGEGSEFRTDRSGQIQERLEVLEDAVRRPSSFAVIGGSALSPPGIGVTDARPVTLGHDRSGYADVGFRLAFSPGGPPPPSVIISEAISRAPYLRTE